MLHIPARPGCWWAIGMSARLYRVSSPTLLTHPCPSLPVERENKKLFAAYHLSLDVQNCNKKSLIISEPGANINKKIELPLEVDES